MVVWGLVFNPFGINTIVDEVYSPDYRYKVVFFEGNSGATSDFITHVSIMEANSELKNSPGNIFRADANHLKAPRAEWGGPDVTVQWVGEREVLLLYHPKARIFEQKKRYKDITISYKYLE